MKLVIAREWDCPFNWKVLVENFMESYHHLGIHHKTLQPMMPARDTWTEQERRHYVRSHLPYKDSVREDYREFEAKGDFSDALPPLPGLNDTQKSEWGLFLIHPDVPAGDRAGPRHLVSPATAGAGSVEIADHHSGGAGGDATRQF